MFVVDQKYVTLPCNNIFMVAVRKFLIPNHRLYLQDSQIQASCAIFFIYTGQQIVLSCIIYISLKVRTDFFSERKHLTMVTWCTIFPLNISVAEQLSNSAVAFQMGFTVIDLKFIAFCLCSIYHVRSVNVSFLFSVAICNPGCQNGGVCSGPNICDCLTGYHGDRCQTHRTTTCMLLKLVVF